MSTREAQDDWATQISPAVRAAMDRADILDEAIQALNEPGTPLPLEKVERALAGAPHDFRLWQVKGLIHREQEQRELAIPALRQAAELAPAEPLVIHGYARTLFEAGLPSVDAYGRALKLAPGDPDVVKGLAAALVAENRIADAIAGLEGVLRRSPLWTDGHVLLAELRWRSGERDGFARSFDDALKVHPNSQELRREQMEALLLARQFDEVLACIAEGRQCFGDHPLFIAFEAALRSETGAVDAADALFLALEEFSDSHSDIRLVRHLLRTSRPEKSLPIIDKWINSPEHHLFWPSASIAWRLTGDPRAEWLEGDGRLIGIYDIEAELPSLTELVGTLRSLHKSENHPLAQSVRGGTQTDGNLFHRIDPAITCIREAVRRTVAHHVAGLPALDLDHPLERGRPQRIAFSGAWSVRLFGGGNHTNHVHSRGWLSSALYVALPNTISANGDAGWLTIGEPDSSLALDLAPGRLVEPKVGRLVLFPSWTWHGTRPFCDGERLTIAFDVARAADSPVQ